MKIEAIIRRTITIDYTLKITVPDDAAEERKEELVLLAFENIKLHENNTGADGDLFDDEAYILESTNLSEPEQD